MLFSFLVHNNSLSTNSVAMTVGTSTSSQTNGNGNYKSAVLHRDLHHDFPELLRAEGHYLYLKDGRKIFDASGGAAVACVGVCILLSF